MPLPSPTTSPRALTPRAARRAAQHTARAVAVAATHARHARLLVLGAAAGLVLAAALVLGARGAGAQTVGAASFVGTGNPVFVRFLGSDAGDRSELWVRVGGFSSNLADYQLLFANAGANAASVGGEYRVGTVADGTELVFALRNTSLVGTPLFYSGVATRNADGRIHLGLVGTASQQGVSLAGAGGARYTVAAGFEDRPAPGADFDYNDVRFEVAGVRTTTAVVPEPGTLVLLAAGALGVGVVAVRRRG